jgi:Fur family ferric uptake transcriptional regulator
MSGRKMKEETELFYSYLRQNGLKKTYQKDLILETFLNTEGHLSVEDIYSLVKKRDKKVGIVTVFRTLKSLTACGIAREITLGDGLTRFEHSYHHPHHHHIVCTECHKAIEFVSPELERIQGEIVARYHFQPVHHRFQIFGICEDCRESRDVPETQKYDTDKVFARDALRMALSMERRGVEFYRSAAARNMDPAGRDVLSRIADEETQHLQVLEQELAEIESAEKGLDQAPLFLHFESDDLEKLLPDLRPYESNGGLRLGVRKSLELALQYEERAAGFFREFADKFLETRGKRIFQRFADDEQKHFEQISMRMEELAPAS